MEKKNYSFDIKKIVFLIIVFISLQNNLLNAQTWLWDKLVDFYDIPDIAVKSNGNIYVTISNASSVLYYISSDTLKTKSTNFVGCYDFVSRELFFNKNEDLFLICRRNEEGMVLRTTNEGIKWDTVYTGSQVISMYEGKSGCLYIGNWSGEAHTSTDNGNTWKITKLSKTFVSSFAISSTGVVYAGSDQGLFTSSNDGINWLKVEELGDCYNYPVYITKKDWVIRCSFSVSFISFDLGKNWHSTNITGVNSFTESPDGKLFACTRDGVYLFDTVSLSWNQICSLDHIIRMVFLKNLVFVSSNDGIYVCDPQKKPYLGKNYFPLNKGNKWQYMIFSTNSMGTLYSYFMTIDSVICDTTINSFKYYKLLSNPTQWMRYSEDEKKIFIYDNAKDNLFMDFNLNDGSRINQYCGGSQQYRDVEILVDYQQFFGRSVHCKTYNYQYSHGYSTASYGENLGPVSYGTGYNIVQAVLNYVDSTKKFSYNPLPSFTVTPLTKTNDTLFNLQFKVTHPYSLIRTHEYYGNNEVCFIDSVILYSYYGKNEQILNNPAIQAIRTEFTTDFNISYPLDMKLLKSGYSLYYKIYALDKGIIPNYKYSPDTGYYKLDYSTNPVNVKDEKENNYPYKLEQCFPNPFNVSTVIFYNVPREAIINITVYNSLGQAVKELVNEKKTPGIYRTTFYSDNLPSGIYYYQLKAGGYSTVKKLIILK